MYYGLTYAIIQLCTKDECFAPTLSVYTGHKVKEEKLLQ